MSTVTLGQLLVYCSGQGMGLHVKCVSLLGELKDHSLILEVLMDQEPRNPFLFSQGTEGFSYKSMEITK